MSEFWGKKADRAFKEASSRQGGGKFLPLFKWPQGDTDIRMLPAAKGEDPEDWFAYVGQHYSLGTQYPVTCPQMTDWADDPCAVCKLVEEMRESGQNDEAKKIAARPQFMARAIVRGEEEKGVQLIRMPSTLFKQISQFLKDTETFGNPLDISPKGKDIRVHRDGENIKTTYMAQVLPKELALAPKEEALEILNGLAPIMSLIEIPDAEEVSRVLESKYGYAPGVEGMGSPAPVASTADGWDADPADVPFGGDTDDSWTADDASDDDDGSGDEVDMEKVAKESRSTKVSLKDDLEGDLEKSGAKVTRKRAQSRKKAD